MSRNQDSPLPARIEHELAHWELDEPSDDAFEAMARAIERRVADVTPGLGEDGDWLLRAPLPLGNGERVLRDEEQPSALASSPRGASGPNGVVRAAPDSDHLSLKEIAEAAVRDSQPELLEGRGRSPALLEGRGRSPARSGIHLIAIADTATAPGESMRPRDARPGPVAPLPPRAKAENAAVVPAGATAVAVASATAPVATGSAVVPGSDKVTTSAPNASRGRLYAFVGALAVAATTSFWFFSHTGGQDTVAANAPVAAVPAAPPPANAEPASPKGESEGAKGATQTPPSEAKEVEVAGIDPLTLPEEPSRAPASGAGRKAASAKPTPEQEPAAASPAAPAPVEPRLVPAAELSSQPKHPSLGAAQAAVGSTLGSARLCLAGQLSPSQAMVIFGSNGRVSAVRVSGPAAGSPAEECIQRAMASARVQPFTDESFSVRTTVRP